MASHRSVGKYLAPRKYFPYAKRIVPTSSEQVTDAFPLPVSLSSVDFLGVAEVHDHRAVGRPSLPGAGSAGPSPPPLRTVTTATPPTSDAPAPPGQGYDAVGTTPTSEARQPVSESVSQLSVPMDTQPAVRDELQGASPLQIPNQTTTVNKTQVLSSETSASPPTSTTNRVGHKRPTGDPEKKASPRDAQGKRSCLTMDHPVDLTSGSVRYKATVKALTPRSLATIPNRILQANFDSCLGTKGFRGFAVRPKSNTIAVWLPTLTAVDRLQMLKFITITPEDVVPVQVYLVEGSDLQRYVVYGVDCNEDQAVLQRELYCPTHRIIAARYMGKKGSCLVTLQGPPTPPACLYYYGCILRPQPYKPSVVYCYKCFRPGHMHKSCPSSSQDEEMAESQVSYQCGLCKSNDHHITSPTCPTKRKATETLRRRQNHRLQTFKTNTFAVPTANRFSALQWDEEDWPDLPDLGSAPEQPVLYI